MADLANDQELKEIFDKDVLELIGGQNISQEEKEKAYLQMAETVQNRTIARIYGELSEADGKELDQLIDTGDQQKVDEFLQSKNIDMTGYLVKEAIIYKMQIADLFKKEPKQGE